MMCADECVRARTCSNPSGISLGGRKGMMVLQEGLFWGKV